MLCCQISMLNIKLASCTVQEQSKSCLEIVFCGGCHDDVHLHKFANFVLASIQKIHPVSIHERKFVFLQLIRKSVLFFQTNLIQAERIIH